MDDVLKAFLAETSQSLDACEGDLGRLRESPQDAAALAKVMDVVRSIAEMSAVLGLRQLRAAAGDGLDTIRKVQVGGPGAMARIPPIASDCLAEIRALIGVLGRAGSETPCDDRTPPARASDPPRRPAGPAAEPAALFGAANTQGAASVEPPMAVPATNVVLSSGPRLHVDHELRIGGDHGSSSRAGPRRRGLLLAIGAALSAASLAAVVFLLTTDRKAEAELLVGTPEVIDTGTLRISGRQVRLDGVSGTAGPQARAMASYIGDRAAVCRHTAGDRYRCEIAGWDLSEAVLHNGGGRATATAPLDLIEAERRAREAGRGVWAAP